MHAARGTEFIMMKNIFSPLLSVKKTDCSNKHSQQALLVTIKIITLKKKIIIIMRKLLCNYSLSQLQFWHVWMNPPSAALTGVCSHCRRSWIPVKGLVMQPPGRSHVPEWGGRNRDLREPTEINEGQRNDDSNLSRCSAPCSVISFTVKNTWSKNMLRVKSKSFAPELACAAAANEAC